MGVSPTESCLLTLKFCFLIIFKGEDHAGSITQALNGGPWESEYNQADKWKKGKTLESFIHLHDKLKIRV